jgi:hypothetical protein
MTKRTPDDGEPFYCTVCGLGWNEYIACEETDCRLETREQAEARADRRALPPQSRKKDEGDE